jgi:hypothetical protein
LASKKPLVAMARHAAGAANCTAAGRAAAKDTARAKDFGAGVNTARAAGAAARRTRVRARALCIV